jgi:hypothetical protein
MGIYVLNKRRTLSVCDVSATPSDAQTVVKCVTIYL